MYLYERRAQTSPVDEPNIMGSSPRIEELLANEWPEMGLLFNSLMTSCIPFVRQYYKAGSSAAEDIIFTQAMSDFNALLLELSQGSGRSASRSARTLIEGAINRSYVIANPEAAERYVDHLELRARFELEFVERQTWPTRALKKRHLTAARHAYKKVEARIRHLLTEKYESQFYRSWSTTSLLLRAEAVDLDRLYPAYRLLSQITHGSPLAIVGLHKDVSRRNVVRTGPDLSACSVAYLAGFQAFLEIVRSIKRSRPSLDTTISETMLATALELWPEYDRTVRAADRQLWPKEPPVHALTILAVSRNGSKRWYWYDPDSLALIEAETPTLDDELSNQVDRATKRVLDSPEMFFVGTTQYATVTMPNIEVNPRPGARILPATSILIRSDEIVGERPDIDSQHQNSSHDASNDATS